MQEVVASGIPSYSTRMYDSCSKALLFEKGCCKDNPYSRENSLLSIMLRLHLPGDSSYPVTWCVCSSEWPEGVVVTVKSSDWQTKIGLSLSVRT